MRIEFIARNGKNKITAATPQEAVSGFLKKYRNFSLTVSEYRDGVFKCCIGDESQSYFFKRFNTRQEAKAFADEAREPLATAALL